MRCWTEWLKFCTTYNVDSLTATHENVVSYLVQVSERFSPSVSTAYTHLLSLAYNYRIWGKTSITEATVVTMHMKGLKCCNINVPVNQAIPMTIEVLCDLQKLLDNDPRLVTWQTVWRAHVKFILLWRCEKVRVILSFTKDMRALATSPVEQVRGKAATLIRISGH